MIAPEYYCAPTTFAAVTGCPRKDAHRALAHWQKMAGWEPAPTVTPMILAAALACRSYPLERWSTTPGKMIEERAADFQRRIWRTVRQDRQLVRNIETAVSDLQDFRATLSQAQRLRAKIVAAMAAERAEARACTPYTVGQWLERRPIATWILHTASHVSAARAGELITPEDPSIHDAELREVWRVGKRAI